MGAMEIHVPEVDIGALKIHVNKGGGRILRTRKPRRL